MEVTETTRMAPGRLRCRPLTRFSSAARPMMMTIISSRPAIILPTWPAPAKPGAAVGSAPKAASGSNRIAIRVSQRFMV